MISRMMITNTQKAILRAAIISFLMCFFAAFIVHAAETSDFMPDAFPDNAADAPFALHVLDVGEGQCVLCACEGKYMLIDGGGRGTSSFVVSYLKQQGIEMLDYIAVSHFEEDHMSGVIGVLAAFDCGALLLPSYEGEGSLYRSLLDKAMSNGCDILHPDAGQSFTLSGADVRMIGPQHDDYAVENDRSLCMKISYADTSFIVCGDAQQASEADMVSSGEDLDADLYVVNHHGSSTSSTDAFLDSISPSYAVISCGDGNRYGHPAMETLQRLLARGIAMFRTDDQGTVIAWSDGQNIWLNTEPSDDWTTGDSIFSFDPEYADRYAASVTRGMPAVSNNTGFVYVCNTHTKKFHYPDCSSVGQMKEENRMDSSLSREELIAAGYSPCGNCRP